MQFELDSQCGDRWGRDQCYCRSEALDYDIRSSLDSDREGAKRIQQKVKRHNGQTPSHLMG